MKKLFVCLMLLAFPVGYFVDAHPSAQQPEEYAKWGKLALSKTQERYPNASVKDYKHIGRVHGTNTTIEKFKFWLTEKDREFGVLVNIEFDKESERVLDITFEEVEK